jgi:hypothetical protein
MPEGVIAGVVEFCFEIMFRFLRKDCKILLEFSTMIANSLAKVPAVYVILIPTGGAHCLGAGIPESPYYKRARVKFFFNLFNPPIHAFIH